MLLPPDFILQSVVVAGGAATIVDPSLTKDKFLNEDNKWTLLYRIACILYRNTENIKKHLNIQPQTTTGLNRFPSTAPGSQSAPLLIILISEVTCSFGLRNGGEPPLTLFCVIHKDNLNLRNRWHEYGPVKACTSTEL